MRAIFGIGALLICIGVIAYLSTVQVGNPTTSGKAAMDEAQRLAGKDADGKPAINALKLLPEKDASGHLTRLVVADITDGSAIQKAYGLQKRDKIIRAGQYDVATNDDQAVAESMITQAFQASLTILVLRDGKEIELPLATPPGSTPNAVSPAQSALDDAARLKQQLGQPQP